MYFFAVYFTAVYLNALLLVRGYRLSNCIDQHKTWPTSLNYFTVVSFYNVLDCSVLCFDVLFCSWFDYSSLNSNVLWHIVFGWGKNYQTALKTETWPTFLNYSTNGSYYSFLYCSISMINFISNFSYLFFWKKYCFPFMVKFFNHSFNYCIVFFLLQQN